MEKPWPARPRALQLRSPGQRASRVLGTSSAPARPVAPRPKLLSLRCTHSVKRTPGRDPSAAGPPQPVRPSHSFSTLVSQGPASYRCPLQYCDSVPRDPATTPSPHPSRGPSAGSCTAASGGSSFRAHGRAPFLKAFCEPSVLSHSKSVRGHSIQVQGFNPCQSWTRLEPGPRP